MPLRIDNVNQGGGNLVLIYPAGGGGTPRTPNQNAGQANPDPNELAPNEELEVASGGSCELQRSLNAQWPQVAKITNPAGQLTMKVKNPQPGDVERRAVPSQKGRSILPAANGQPARLVKIESYSRKYKVTIGADTTTIRG